MGKRKIGLVCLMIISLVFTVKVWGDDFKPGSEPDGWRGIKWGTDVSTLKDMESVKSASPETFHGLMKEYKRNGDSLRMGDSKVDIIMYYFFKDKLVKIGILLSGRTNFDKLRNECFKVFGGGRVDYTKNKDGKIISEKYEWEGNISKIVLGIICDLSNQNYDTGILSLYSSKWLKEIELMENKKSKERLGF